ncbi:YhcH/YjgK/YiaL family protein [Streptococcus sp. H31]|uniref:YhcH/YjgK/YiaL family protein n=1 Tax=Streptococcus huangxiaojuni TaxID=3237239 RepID=UPI0034A461F2
MIIDRAERLEYYQPILPKIKDALAVLEAHKDDWEAGVSYSFSGGRLFFQKGRTKPLELSQFEAHRKFIDVQFVLEGAEYVALEDLTELSIALPYQQEKDVEKYEGSVRHYMKITEGMAYVCFPWDAHRAVFHTDEELTFTKAVVKLAVEERREE